MTYRNIRWSNDGDLTKANSNNKLASVHLPEIANAGGVHENPKEPSSTHETAPPESR